MLPTKARGVENRPSAQCVLEHQNRSVRKIAPIPTAMTESFDESLI